MDKSLQSFTDTFHTVQGTPEKSSDKSESSTDLSGFDGVYPDESGALSRTVGKFKTCGMLWYFIISQMLCTYFYNSILKY